MKPIEKYILIKTSATKKRKTKKWRSVAGRVRYPQRNLSQERRNIEYFLSKKKALNTPHYFIMTSLVTVLRFHQYIGSNGNILLGPSCLSGISVDLSY